MWKHRTVERRITVSHDSIVTLVLFRLQEGVILDTAIPGGDCAALTISGGVTNLRQKVRDWESAKAEYADPPFVLAKSVSWVVPCVLSWLCGPAARMYIMLSGGSAVAQEFGLPEPSGGWYRYTLKLTPDQNLRWDRINEAFFSITSDGLGLVFSGPEAVSERQLAAISSAVPASAPSQWPDPHRRMFAEHETERLALLCQDAHFVIAPFGSECMDCLLITRKMSQDDMIGRIRRAATSSLEILECDGNESYRLWADKGQLAI